MSTAFSTVLLLLGELLGEPVDALHRPYDLGSLLVETSDEGVQLREKRLDPALAALERVVQLLGDRVELGHPTAVEQRRQRREHLLDLRVAVAAGQRDRVAVGELPRRADIRRLGERHVLLAEDAGLAQIGDRVGGQFRRVGDTQPHPGAPAVQFHLLNSPDGDVVDLDGRLRHQVEDVAELDRDAVGIAVRGGAARQLDVLQAAELAAGQQHR